MALQPLRAGLVSLVCRYAHGRQGNTLHDFKRLSLFLFVYATDLVHVFRGRNVSFLCSSSFVLCYNRAISPPFVSRNTPRVCTPRDRDVDRTDTVGRASAVSRAVPFATEFFFVSERGQRALYAGGAFFLEFSVYAHWSRTADWNS